MEIIEFCFLAMIYLTSRSNSFEIISNGTAWLGESIHLRISDVPNMKRPVVWQSENYKYDCDMTCSSGNYTVTQNGNTSTLTIKNISWDFPNWTFMDEDFRTARLELDIKVKPMIEIMKKGDCMYIISAQCSLPPTDIKCFIGKNQTKFIASNTNGCPDGKTVSHSVTLHPQSLVSGTVDCIFIMSDIFEEKRSIDFECATKPETIAGNDTPSRVFIFTSNINLVLGITSTQILFKY